MLRLHNAPAVAYSGRMNGEQLDEGRSGRIATLLAYFTMGVVTMDPNGGKHPCHDFRTPATVLTPEQAKDIDYISATYVVTSIEPIPRSSREDKGVYVIPPNPEDNKVCMPLTSGESTQTKE